jgi:hypothetical protein
MNNLRKYERATTDDFKFVKKGQHSLCIARVGQLAGEWHRELSEQNTLFIQCDAKTAHKLTQLVLTPTTSANMINVSQGDIVERWNEQFKTIQ